VSLPSVRFLSSVRARTTAAATLVVAIALTIGAVLLLQTLESGLSRNQDDTARSRVRDLATLAAEGSLPRLLAPAGDDGFIQVVDGSGSVRASTPNVANRPPAFTFAARTDAPVGRTVRGIRDDQDLEDYRVLAMRAESPSGPVTVYVANSLELVSDAVAALTGILLVGIPVLVALLGIVAWIVVGRALQPVESIRSQVADISDAGLDRRVPIPAGHDEVAHLARTMNEMLDRLSAASARQRAFAADASHELQSPLARFRTQLEVALAYPDGVEWREVAASLLADSAEMERLVRDLLFLAREDERSPGERSDVLVDLDDVVLEEAARVRVGSAREVDTTEVSAAPVRGSREQLGRLVRNLLENATRYAAVRVHVRLTTSSAGVELVVRDDGPGVPRDKRQRIFDRFVRLDQARLRETGGSGLGLAIVDAIARQHGGDVRLDDGDSAAGGATFVVRLPTPLDQPGTLPPG
jgi:signal transduction histidine kinase